MTMMPWHDNAMMMVRWHNEAIARLRDGTMAIARWWDSDDAMRRFIVSPLSRHRHCFTAPSLYRPLYYTHVRLKIEIASG